jgi:hypothetical protein
MRWFWCAVAALLMVGIVFAFRAGNAPAPAPVTAPAREPEPAPVAAPIETKPAPAITPAATPAPLDFLGDIGKKPDDSAKPARTLLTDKRAPSEVARRIDERTLELDGRFRVIGNGSPDDPYRISWELLTSASLYIDASQGVTQPPPWVRLLDGSTVEISGYYSTAVRVQRAKSLLLTLNRWDGCCVGLPPTPFDAIEITMRSPLEMGGLHVVRFGTFRGKLAVAPIETGGFLLGLYKLDDATFETK